MALCAAYLLPNKNITKKFICFWLSGGWDSVLNTPIGSTYHLYQLYIHIRILKNPFLKNNALRNCNFPYFCVG